ncbi:VWA domain-containing protein [Deltaproteobacteria bacterium TL4]
MHQILSQFSSTLRAAGIRVSTAEVLDCASALPCIQSFEREIFKITLQAHLIKTQKDLGKFNHCFELFFDQADPDQALSFFQPEETDPVQDFLREQMQETLQELPSEPLSTMTTHQAQMDLAVMDFLANNDERILEIIEQTLQGQVGPISSQNSPLSGFFVLSKRLEIQKSIDTVRSALKGFFKQAGREENSIEYLKQLYRQRRVQNARLDLLSQMLSGTQTRNVFKTRIYKDPLPEQNEIRGKSLFSLEPEEKEQIFFLMRNLIRKVNTNASLRLKQHHRGKINIKKTFRESMRYGGLPIKLHYQNKLKRKGEIVVLCDVSGSVYTMAKVMLSLIYSLSSQFRQVRSFAFIDDMVEITEYFENDQMEETVEQVLADHWKNGVANSDYGQAFREFESDYMSIIGPRTTVIIFGDARNNGRMTEHRIVEQMKERGKRLLWLNPERSNTWNMGDSEVDAYLPSCTEFRECRNYEQLEAFIHKLSLS